MRLSKIVSSLVLAGVVAGISLPSSALADGVVGQYVTKVPTQGILGEVVVNPYQNAPQTAIISRGGKHISNVTVTIEPKKGGTTMKYKVPKSGILTHDGIPVFGLYADYNNKVHVKYTLAGKEIKETYNIYVNPIQSYEGEFKTANGAKYTPVKSSPEFKDRLYFVNNLYYKYKPQFEWFRAGGALDFSYPSESVIIDAKGDVRWHFNTMKYFQKDTYNIDKMGFSMSYRQLDNGDIIFIQGQRYARYDIMGREIFNRRLPRGFIDSGHEMFPMKNGHFLIRAAKRYYERPDGKIVNTIKDHVFEVDETGKVVSIWDLSKSLDSHRDVLLKALDQRAVCMSVDKDAKHIDVKEDAPLGDIVGVESGRNWGHTNSVYYDESDDSIVVSLRHQGMAKITRDNKVKWILAPFAGWKGELAKKVLVPVDKNGKKLKCDENSCEGDFDWSFTQHTAYLNPELGKGYLTVFDNGEGRGNDQPAMIEDKYSRAVAYKIDEKKGTVQQLWEYGKDRGFEWFSVVTGNVNYDHETKSFHTGSLNVDLMKFKKDNKIKGRIDEIKLDKNGKPYLANEIQVEYSGAEFGYRTGIVKKNRLFGK